MTIIKYKIIKSELQYFEYCNVLEVLVGESNADADEIELLTFLIEKWDAEHSTITDSDPIELLKYLMYENKLKSVELAGQLGINKSTMSEILNYRKGLSKEIIRKLAERFKMRQEIFNRPYKLISAMNIHLRDASVMNNPKKLAPAN